MKSSEVRRKFLEFFGSKGHDILPSASLVPHDDPSLLWINAGMAPLKKYFDGREIPKNPRMTNSQKCIRTNDIENVGKTARHQTFFEMLGNFSIGDYFKKEAIEWAWEFLTKEIGFDPERLSVTIHHEDEEAFEIWHTSVGIPEERIVRLDDENFWDIGEGPCGPCSEIYYDRQLTGCTSPDCKAGACECDRYLEIWNLVFSQYNHNPDGSYTPLPKKNIDTGMGLERMCSLLQDVETNFDTDLFRPIIDRTCGLANVTYPADTDTNVALKVIADHVRTVAFSIGDGVLPSNEGRGYVIRRLLRRAVRYGKVLGIEKPFLYELVSIVGQIMGEFYPAVVEKAGFIVRVIRSEEERFHETLSAGENRLSDLIASRKAVGEQTISGHDAFMLYDTYGFPIDLTEDIAAEQGMTVDRGAFEQALDEQRVRARAARQEIDSMQSVRTAVSQLTVESRFVGYQEYVTMASVAALVKDGEFVERVHEGDVCDVVLDRTPFYAESGGQVSDRGMITCGQTQLQVTAVYKAPLGQHVMSCEVVKGELSVGDLAEAAIDVAYRKDIVKNHTGTHLLHKALREVLGEHVAQAGSLVEDERLRFDFSHFGAVTKEELQDIEQRVNHQIWLDEAVDVREMPIDEAKALGAMALFGEKYGEVVRVVKAGDYSTELCGGCHVARTGEIGIFKIVSEAGIGAGVRRIEAVTGRFAYQYGNDREKLLEQAAKLLKTNGSEVPQRIEGLLGALKDLNREIESLKGKVSAIEAESLEKQAVLVDDVQVLAAAVKGMDMDALRATVDGLKAKLSNSVIVLGSTAEGKVNFVASVSKDLHSRGLHAGKIIKEVASIAGGSGGGRPDMAQAGGKSPEKLQEAIGNVMEIVKNFL
ncbi:alanine--tRNA ligase [Fodinisporobacter ferrooxydans]|uniref:Alanine--tRNA ligase n=1 Tax=Fodinisporobacter ferrooxydans TaxID=2901836 RepID=A0ABY4CLX6_9BACL|nr:alanine--tRNA ligase [Alicyclobacillaceae bacterium MYW30-H2]